MDKQGYSFTFTIPPQKLVYYSGRRRKYGSMTQRQQWFFLNLHLNKVLQYDKIENVEWVFEEHEDTRLHIHGYIVPRDDITYSMECFMEDFYNLNQIIGIKQSSYKKLCHYEQTYFSKNYWDTYCQKNQDKIIFKSMKDEEREHWANLDNGVIREVKLRPTKEAMEDPNYWKIYRFGQNLFKVEI